MAMDPESPWGRVAVRVRARRRELRLGSQAKAAMAAGVSEPTWGLIENAGQGSYKDFTIDAICHVLEWTPDSIDRIRAGGEPELAPRAVYGSASIEVPPAKISAAGEPLTEAERMAKIESEQVEVRHELAQIRQTLEEIARQRAAEDT